MINTGRAEMKFCSAGCAFQHVATTNPNTVFTILQFVSKQKMRKRTKSFVICTKKTKYFFLDMFNLHIIAPCDKMITIVEYYTLSAPN